MIDIVTPDTYHMYGAQLRDMHRLRYRVFKERLGWDVRTHDDQEHDDFDDLNPTYILAYGIDDEIAGTWRLLPSTGPTMIRDVFPQLLDGNELPRDPAVWECSRFAIDLGNGQANSLGAVSRVTSELFCGLIEFCLAEQIREIVSVYDILISRMLSRVGCPAKWEGRRQRIGKTIAVAGWFDATEELLEKVRNTTGIRESVISAPFWAARPSDVARIGKHSHAQI